MNEIKNLNGYSFVDTQVRESINALTEQVGGLSEEVSAVVESVNDVKPAEMVTFIHMTATGELSCEKTVPEIKELLESGEKYPGLRFALRIYNFTNP